MSRALVNHTDSVRDQPGKNSAGQYQQQKIFWETVTPSNPIEAYTLVLAIATIGLWYFTWRMARATRDAAMLARDEFNATHRPQLRVRNVVVKGARQGHGSFPLDAFHPGFPLSGQFYVANVGSGPAEIVESHCDVLWGLDRLPMERPYEGENGNNPLGKITIPAGASCPAQFLSSENFPGLKFDAFDRSEVYVMGWIEYLDSQHVRRRTAFCRRYWGREGNFRFYAVDDPDYEHEE